MVPFILALFALTIIVGIVAAAYYWRFQYEDISERMNTACWMLRAGRSREKILEVLIKH